MDEVLELRGVTHEEHRGVVADQIPVALLGVELERKATHVALGVGRAELAGDGGEARDHVGLGAFLQRLRLGVFRDVAGDGERAMGAPAFGMHRPLGDALAVLVRKLLDQLIVLQQHGAARTSRDGILVIGDGGAGGRGQGRFLRHNVFSLLASAKCGRGAELGVRRTIMASRICLSQR